MAIFSSYVLLISFSGFIAWLHSILPKFLKPVFGIIGAIGITLQWAAIYANDRFIDERYLANFSPSILWRTRHFYIKEFVLFIVCTILVWFLLKFISNSFKKARNKKLIYWPLALALSSSMLVFNSPLISYLQSLKWLVSANATIPLQEALKNAGINPKAYTPRELLKAKPGKNIIVLSLESFEYAYLEEPLNELTPNLQQLASEFGVHKMQNLPGSDWTAASVYTMLSGLPAYFTTPGNEIFQQSQNHQLINLPYVLAAAGYELEYIIGNPEFGGMGDLLRSFGFTVLSEQNCKSEIESTDWGLHDYDAFTLARRELEHLSESKNPFALFISTISTHPPKGVYDTRVEKLVGKRKSEMETMAAALDFHIGELIRTLKELNLNDETVLYIVPDHLLIGQAAPILQKFPENRSLFLISTSSSVKIPEKLYQVMSPSLFLKGAQVDHNANFWSDYQKTDGIPELVVANKENLRRLNIASLTRYGFGSGINVALNQRENSVQITSGDDELRKETVAACNGFINMFIFDYELRLTKNMTIGTSELAINHLNPGEIGLVIDPNSNNLKADLIAWQGSKIERSGNNDLYFANTEIDHLKKLIFHKVSNSTEKNRYLEIKSIDHLALAKDTNCFIAHAGGSINSKAYTNSLEALDHSYQQGFRYFELDILKTSDNYYVAAHDWETWKSQTGFTGTLPPSRAHFLQHKLFGELNSMDLNAINEWFSCHSDAFLVSDKINEPTRFSGQFIDKKRLNMELFTWDSVRVAQQLNIGRVIVSEHLLYEIDGDKLNFLKKEGVQSIAISRRSFAEHLDYYQFLKTQGIDVFLFHINHDQGKDEVWVLKNELPFAKAMYADEWDFDAINRLVVKTE